jgi:hypothetical protein
VRDRLQVAAEEEDLGFGFGVSPRAVFERCLPPYSHESTSGHPNTAPRSHEALIAPFAGRLQQMATKKRRRVRKPDAKATGLANWETKTPSPAHSYALVERSAIPAPREPARAGSWSGSPGESRGIVRAVTS